MSRTTLWMTAVFAALAFGGQAQAEDIRQLTREEVRNAYFKARAAGTLTPDGEIGYVPQIGTPRPHPSRAEVRAEFEHAKKDGTLAGNGLVGPARTGPAHSIQDHKAGRVH